MTVTSGFFNSIGTDRIYSAEQLSNIFNGIICDGVFETVGSAFSINLYGSRNITVGSGRAWLNGIWIYNDSNLTLAIESSPSDANQKRIDAIILDVDYSSNVRSGTIAIKTGSVGNSPSKPAMLSTGIHKQMPLCYITSRGGVNNLSASDIEIVIGTSECPFVRSPIETLNIEEYLAIWSSAFESYMTQAQSNFNQWFSGIQQILDANDPVSELTNRVVTLENRITPISKGGTGSENKDDAKEALGIIIGTDDPSEIVDSLDEGDVYIYVQEG